MATRSFFVKLLAGLGLVLAMAAGLAAQPQLVVSVCSAGQQCTLGPYISGSGEITTAGSYGGGVTATGTSSTQYCVISYTGGTTPATAKIYLGPAFGTNQPVPAQSIGSTALETFGSGYNYFSPPTTASVANGTATNCTGTATVSGVKIDDSLGLAGTTFYGTTTIDPVGISYGQSQYSASLTLVDNGYPGSLTCTAQVSVTVAGTGDVIGSSCTFKAGDTAFTSTLDLPGGTLPAVVPMAFSTTNLTAGGSITYTPGSSSTFVGDKTVLGITTSPASTIAAACPSTGASPCPTETLSQTTPISFSVPVGSGTTAPQSVTVSTGGDNEAYAVTTSASWLLVNSASATGGTTGSSASFNVAANPAGLAVGSYTGYVCVFSAASNSTASACNASASTPIVTVNLTVTPLVQPPVITPATLPNGEVNVSYSTTLGATGGTPPYSNWTVSSGSLPAGLSLNAGTGAISGTPTAPGTANFSVTVKDSANNTSAPQAFSITIVADPTITTTSLPTGEVGVAYAASLVESGGTGPYTWMVSSGSLPAGLSLSSSSGAISGTPTTTGTASFSVTVKDSDNITSPAASLSITITGVTISTTSLPNGEVGVGYSQTVIASGGTGPPYTWTLTGGSLPGGLTLNSSTGVINGSPTTAGTSSFSVTAKDSLGSTSPAANLSITIVNPLSITTTSLPAGVVNVSYSQSLGATGGTPPYTWTLTTGSLPAGLTLSSGGAITGMPSTAGSSSFSVTVKDSNGLTAGPLSLTITINPALTITTTSLSNGVVNAAYSAQLNATGGVPPYSNWTVSSGSLPAGLTLSSSSGAITGTPTAAGLISFSVTVKDNAGNTSPAANLSINIVSGLTVVTTSLNNGTVGVAYNQTLVAAGGTPPYSNWTVASGSLPAGLTLSSSSGAITGTPSSAGKSTFSVTVQDSTNTTSPAQMLSITIVSQVMITTTTLPAGSLQASYSQALGATGGTPPYNNWTVSSGSLPGGLTLNAASGIIGGTPTATGTFPFTVTVKDSNGVTSPAASLSITIVSSLTISTTSLPGGTVGTPYSQALVAVGGTLPYTWTLTSGSLPAGLTLSSSGAISGTPTNAGSPSFSVTVKDSNGLTAGPQSLSITIVSGALSITTATLPSGPAGVAYSQTLAASGGTPPYSNWTVSIGSLPPGLILNSTSGVISGTPTTGGTYAFSVTVKDSAGNTSPAKALSILIVTPLTITTSLLPSAPLGIAYSQTLIASGGTPPYSNWTVTSGSLPPGLTLNAATGVISGTPTTTTGSPFTFTVTVSDSANNKAPAKSLSITVGTAVLKIGSPSNYFFTLANTAAPATGNVTIVASDGSAQPFTVTATPTGTNWLSFAPTSGVTPATITLTANPAGLVPGVYVTPLIVKSGSLSLTVSAQLTITGSNLAASPSILTFNYQPALPFPAAQTISLTTVTGGTVPLASVTTDVGWLTVTQASSAPATLQVSINPGLLSVGTYGGDVLVKGLGSPNASLEIPVTLTVNAAAKLTSTPATLTFNYQIGGTAPAAQSFAVSASGNVAVNFTATSPGNWLQVSPPSGTTPASVLVTANPAGLAAGTYGGTINVTAPGVNSAPVAVTLTVAGPPQFTIAPSQLTFVAPAGGALPAAQTLTVSSASGPLAFTAAAGSAWLSVSPTSGTTPATLSVSVNPAGLANGVYNGTIDITQAGSVVPQLVMVTLQVGNVTPTIAGVINAASGAVGTVAPGMAISIFGSLLGPQTGVPWTAPTGDATAATSLGGTQVLFDGTPVPLLFSMNGQVNALAPFELAGKASTVLTVSYNGATSAAITLPVVADEPGLFTADASGKGQGAILNQDYSINSATNPIAPGSAIMLFGTGGGVTVPPSIDGTLNPLPTPEAPLGKLAAAVTATVGGQPATVLYAGPAPALVAGIFQINVTIPSGTPSGNIPVVVTLSCATPTPANCMVASSQTVTVAVQ